MTAANTSFPALVERGLRLIGSRGPLSAEELARGMFGNTLGPWARLVEKVLGDDDRLVHLPDGRYALAHRQLSAAGLVVLATGPKPWKDPIVALGAARWRGERVETVEWFVQPGEPCRLPQYLARYGVTEAALADGVPLARAVEELVDFVGDAPLAGLDVAVGVARLQFALRELGRPSLANELRELAVAGDERPDLLRLAKRSGLPVPDRPRPSTLAALAARLARTDPPARRARERRADYSAAARQSALDSTAWRHLLDSRLLGAIPDSPGVYLFRDAAGRLLYVGKASSLRTRLASYLTGNFPLVRQMPGLVEATARLEHESLPCELAARLREAELIAAESPPYNVQRNVEPRLVRASLVLDGDPDGDGRRVPRLALREDDRGVLTTARAAADALADARRQWWPTRPSAADRPSPEAVLTRLAELQIRFEHATRTAAVTATLRADDLAAGLMVGAPERALRRPTADEAEPADGWSRERTDAEWRAARLGAQPRHPAWAALLVDATGLRACVQLDDEPTRDSVAAALSRAPERPRAIDLAPLSVLLAALRRVEPGLVAWPCA